jgi:hypothetical protein
MFIHWQLEFQCKEVCMSLLLSWVLVCVRACGCEWGIIWELAANHLAGPARGTHSTCINLHCMCRDLWHIWQASSLYTLQFLSKFAPVNLWTAAMKQACTLYAWWSHLLAIILNIQLAVFLCWNGTWELHIEMCSCIIVMWNVRKRLQHKFQYGTVANKKLLI